eukprot:scaffold313_cov378-Pavlova_lutheri.AAC.1
MKLDKTTAWYFVACILFHPVYATSSPSVGLRILKIVPSMKPQQVGTGQPRNESASARRGSSSAHTSKRNARLANG